MDDAAGSWEVDDHVDLAISELLYARAAATPDDIYLTFRNVPVTVCELARDVDRYAAALRSLGVGRGDRLLIMMPTNPDHVALFLASVVLGAVSVPADVRSKAAQLGHLLGNAQPSVLVFDDAYRDQVAEAVAGCEEWAADGDLIDLLGAGIRALRRLDGDNRMADEVPDDLVSLIYTSGTSGPPKGTLITDRMLRVCATGVRRTTHPMQGDVFFQWEPLNHVGGTQLIVLALQHRITLALATSFSASRFWEQVRASGASHIHYLGGVLQMLHAAPPAPSDRAHAVRVAWGAGCTTEIWRSFEERFGVEIREVYGLTETSSINTLNDERVVGSMGKPTPEFLVQVVDDQGSVVGPGAVGEIRIRGVEPGMTTPGYFRNPAASSSLYRDGWLYTKDLAYADDAGHLHFVGRRTDSVRRRGENISAWEVERIVREHPDVEECALIGVPSELGEQDLKLFVQPAAGSSLNWGELNRWCLDRMPKHHVPRYFSAIDSFQRGPSMRIVKSELSRDTVDSWDREAHASTGV